MFRASFLFTALLCGCNDTCSNKVLAAVWNGDHSRQLGVFERSCGATTGFSYHVAIIGQGEDVRETGNVLVVDGDHGTVRDPIPTVRWQGNEAAEIILPKGVRVFKKADRIDGVTFTYRER